MNIEKTPLRIQFDTMEQQTEAARLGLWLFLATELLFFGALFMGFTIYHLVYPVAFAAAEKQTNLVCGSVNTAIILTSGLFMSLALYSIQQDRPAACIRYLLLTLALGLGFLSVKGLEYAGDIHEHLVPGGSFALKNQPAAQIFFFLYWLMTALHAIHMIVGIGLLAVMAFLVRRGRFSREYHTPIELTAIYWGFVDLIWIFLYPLLYLIDRHQ